MAGPFNVAAMMRRRQLAGMMRRGAGPAANNPGAGIGRQFPGIIDSVREHVQGQSAHQRGEHSNAFVQHFMSRPGPGARNEIINPNSRVEMDAGQRMQGRLEEMQKILNSRSFIPTYRMGPKEAELVYRLRLKFFEWARTGQVRNMKDFFIRLKRYLAEQPQNRQEAHTHQMLQERAGQLSQILHSSLPPENLLFQDFVRTLKIQSREAEKGKTEYDLLIETLSGKRDQDSEG